MSQERDDAERFALDVAQAKEDLAELRQRVDVDDMTTHGDLPGLLSAALLAVTRAEASALLSPDLREGSKP